MIPFALLIAAILIAAAVFILMSPSQEKKDAVISLEPEKYESIVKNKEEEVLKKESFNKPGPNKRVCGYLIDLLILTLIQWGVTFLTNIGDLWAIFVFYWLLKDIFGGASLGKRLLGMRIINEEGNRASMGECILRNIPIAIPFFSIIEYFVMLKNKEGRRLGDKIAHTRVANLKPQAGDVRYLFISILVLLIGFMVASLSAYSSGDLDNILKKDPSRQSITQ